MGLDSRSRGQSDVQSISLSGYAPTYASLSDPPGSSVILAAVSWLEGTMLGTAATVLAVIAISCVGFLMLSGRMAIRPGAAAVLGSFILFGASSIVAGLRSFLPDGEPAAYVAPPPAPVTAPPPAFASAAVPAPAYDPYAGASVPTQ